MPYEVPYYGEPLYGEIDYNPYYIWAIEVDWDGDGHYDGYNEASRCIGLSIRRGRELPVESGQGFEHVNIGEARITLSNYDDRYNYYNTSSPYYPNVKQGKYIRIRVANGATSTPVALFTGTITDIELQEEGQTGSTVVLSCKDGWYFLEKAVTNIAVSTTYTTGTAISAILTDIGWPSIWGSSVDTGVDSLAYFWATDKNAREAIDELNDSEFGTVRIAADGTFEFFERGHEPSADVSLTQSDILTDISLPAPWKTMRNKAIVHVYPRILREDEILYEMRDVPSIEPDDTLIVWGDLSYSGRTVASNSISQPIACNRYENQTTIAFVAATKKITDSGNGLAGFTTGMKIYVSGASTPSNNGTFTVATGGVAGEIVVAETLVDESAKASVTIDQAISYITANAADDGSGADMTSSASVTATLYGEKVKNSIKNLDAVNTMYITEYRIVGDAVDCPNPATVEVDNSGTAETNPFELDMPWLSVAQYAANYAAFLGEYLNSTDPFPIIKIENRPEAQFYGDLFDKIGLGIDKLGIDATDYKISKIEHEWNLDTGQSVTTKWYTEKRTAAAEGGNVMVNGDFETGDFTSWTQTGAQMSVVGSGQYEGDYTMFCDTVSSGTNVLTSDRIAAVENQTYKISLATKETYTSPDLHDLQCDATEVAYIDSANADTNYDGSNIVGGYTGGHAYRALYKFDFSSIPSGAVIAKATLKNNLTAVDSQVDTNGSLFRTTEAWSDATVTWNTQPEYEPTGIGSLHLASAESTGLKSITLAPDYLNEMLDTWTDNGFVFVASPEGGTVEETCTTYWREYYDIPVRRAFGIISERRYRTRSKTYTVSPATSNKYTFDNTPYIDLTYDTIAYPRPHYTIQIKWYNDPDAGDLIRTDTICSENQQMEWNIRSIQLNSPTDAESFEIVITATQSAATFYVDDIKIYVIGYYQE